MFDDTTEDEDDDDEFIVKPGPNREEKREIYNQAAKLAAARKKPADQNELSEQMSRETIEQLVKFHVQHGITPQNINATRLVLDELSQSHRDQETNLQNQRAHLVKTMSRDTTTATTNRYTRHRDIVTGGATPSPPLASQEQKIQKKIPRINAAVDDELMQPPSTKRVRQTDTPESLLASTAHVLPLTDYQGALTSEQRLSADDPWTGLMFDTAKGVLSAEGDGEREMSATDYANMADLVNTEVYKKYVARIDRDRRRQSETNIGHVRTWINRVEYEKTPRELKQSDIQPLMNSWSVKDDLLEGLQTESENIVQTMQQPMKVDAFKQQLIDDFNGMVSGDNIYNDSLFSDAAKEQFRAQNVQGSVDGKYTPGMEMDSSMYKARIDPDEDPEAAQTIRDKLSRVGIERSIVFRTLLEEVPKGTEDAYVRRTDKNVQANMRDQHPDVPWVRHAYLKVWLRQPPPEYAESFRMCSQKGRCLCNTMASEHRGLVTPAQRPTHGAVNGMAAMAVDTHQSPSVDLGRSAEVNAIHNHSMSHGFINVEFLLPHEFNRFVDSGELPAENRTCLLCHIAHVNHQFHSINDKKMTSTTGDASDGFIRPVNLFQVYVDEPGEYDSAFCLSLYQGHGSSGVIGHFPMFLPDRYQYSTYTPASHPSIELQQVVEVGMDFHRSSAK